MTDTYMRASKELLLNLKARKISKRDTYEEVVKRLLAKEVKLRKEGY